MKRNWKKGQRKHMKGLELSQRFYLEYGAPMINELFPQIGKIIAIGLAGSGSECFGFDDEISQDHDFEPGFCIFVPDEIDSRTEFALERAYAKLPKEFMGFKRSPLSPVGGNRHGVLLMSEFFKSKTGSPDGKLSLYDWLSLPEQSVAEAVNGAVFRDDSGAFTEIRRKLSYMPEEIRLKKLAGELLMMGQTGQYNYGRCISRSDTAAAQLTLTEFVKHALHAIFLINKVYQPYYKWSFRALKNLPSLSHLYTPLEGLLCNTESNKQETMETVCREISHKLTALSLSRYVGSEAEGHAYSVNDRIQNEEIRNLHILSGV